MKEQLKRSGTPAPKVIGVDERIYIKGQKYTLLSNKENLTLDGKRSLKKLLKANRISPLSVFPLMENLIEFRQYSVLAFPLSEQTVFSFCSLEELNNNSSLPPLLQERLLR